MRALRRVAARGVAMIAHSLESVFFVCGAVCLLFPALRHRFSWRLIAIGLVIAIGAGVINL
jgi:hypothetical protein